MNTNTNTSKSNTQIRNGNILCAQVSMILHGVQCAVTCRDNKVHIQTPTHERVLILNWKDKNFHDLQEYCEFSLTEEEV